MLLQCIILYCLASPLVVLPVDSRHNVTVDADSSSIIYRPSQSWNRVLDDGRRLKITSDLNATASFTFTGMLRFSTSQSSLLCSLCSRNCHLLLLAFVDLASHHPGGSRWSFFCPSRFERSQWPTFWWRRSSNKSIHCNLEPDWPCE